VVPLDGPLVRVVAGDQLLHAGPCQRLDEVGAGMQVEPVSDQLTELEMDFLNEYWFFFDNFSFLEFFNAYY
jgi:hypothetical protein